MVDRNTNFSELINKITVTQTDVTITTNKQTYTVSSSWGKRAVLKVNDVSINPESLKNRVVLDHHVNWNGSELIGENGKLKPNDYNGCVFLLDNNDVLKVQVFKG